MLSSSCRYALLMQPSAPALTVAVVSVVLLMWVPLGAWGAEPSETARVNQLITKADAELAQQQIDCRQLFANTI